MAVAVASTAMASPRAAYEVRITELGAVPQSDLRGGACTLYDIHVKNTGASAALAYLKLYNNLAPTVGTTAPDVIIPIAINADVNIVMACPDGYAFSTGLSAACVKEAGTAGTTAPDDEVDVSFITS